MSDDGSRVSFDRGEYDKLRVQVTESAQEISESLSGEGGPGGSMLVDFDVIPAAATWEPIVAVRTLCRTSGTNLKAEVTKLGRKELPDYKQALDKAVVNFEEVDDLADSTTAFPGSGGGAGGSSTVTST